MTNSHPNSFGWNAKRRPSGHVIDNVLLSQLPNNKQFSLVDLGFGDGTFLKKVHDLFPLACLYGIERDIEGYDIAHSLLPDIQLFNIPIDQAACSDCLQERSFDFVISSEVIEHMYDPSALFKVACFLLKPSGRLIITTPYHGYLKNLCLSVLNKWDRHFHVSRIHGHIKFFSYLSIMSLANSYGFDFLSFAGIGRLPFLWKSMCITFTPPSGKCV